MRFASPTPTNWRENSCPDWVGEETPERKAALDELADLLAGSPLDPDGDLALGVDTCTCPPGRMEMTVGNLAARHRVCLFAEWVGRENTRLWQTWRAGEINAQKELGQ